MLNVGDFRPAERRSVRGNPRKRQGSLQKVCKPLLSFSGRRSLRLLGRSLRLPRRSLLLLRGGARNAGCRGSTLGGSSLRLSLDPAGVAAYASTARREESQDQAAYKESYCQSRGRFGQKRGCSPASEDGPGDTRSSEGSGQTFAFGGLHQDRDDQGDADYHMQHGQDYYQ